MIAPIRAFVWLRWRLFVNGLRGRRRDSLEQVARISRLFVFAILGIAFVPGSILLALLAFAGGRGMAAGDPKAMPTIFAVRAVLAGVTIITTIGPALRLSGGAAGMTRLALLPVPRGLLFAAEWGSQIVDPWLLALIPSLIALPAGVAAGGRPGAAIVVLAAGAIVLAFLASLGCAASLSSALVFRRRRWGEAATLGLVLAISLFAYLPILTSRGAIVSRPGTGDGGAPATRPPPFDLDPAHHPILVVTPWEMYASALEKAASPRGGLPVAQVAGLLAGALLLGSVGRAAFGRLQDAPGERRARSGRGAVRLGHVPGLSPAASAVARSTFRLVTRSIRGRLVLFSTAMPAVLFSFLWRSHPLGPIAPAYTGVLVLGVAGALALVSLATILSDQFAVDRAGLTLTFLTPANAYDIVSGKAVGLLGALSLSLGATTVVAVAFHPHGSAWVWIGAVLSLLSAYLLQSPVSATLAALFPAPLDLSRLKAGNPHPLASLLTSLAAGLSYLVCGAIFGGALVLTDRPVAGALAALALATGSVAVARLGWRRAARVLEARRENLALVAQGR